MVNVTARVPVNNGDSVIGTRRRLILRSFQSPGDILMLTAAVRDLHAAALARFHTDVRFGCSGAFLDCHRGRQI